MLLLVTLQRLAELQKPKVDQAVQPPEQAASESPCQQPAVEEPTTPVLEHVFEMLLLIAFGFASVAAIAWLGREITTQLAGLRIDTLARLMSGM